MAEGNALLVIWTDIASEYEAEFNEWYNSEHIPQLLRVPGFIAARRYAAVEGQPKYITIYDLSDEKVGQGESFRRVREQPTAWTQKMLPQLRNLQRGFFRKIFSFSDRPELDAEYVLTVRLNTPVEKERDFNVWYNEDHLPALARVDGVYCARRYQIVEGNPKYLAIYEMNDAGVVRTPEWDRARKFGRTAEIRPYLEDLQAVVARRIFPQLGC
jgi:hypothetical protein